MNEHSTMFKTEEKHLAFFDLPPKYSSSHSVKGPWLSGYKAGFTLSQLNYIYNIKSRNFLRNVLLAHI